MYSLKFALRHFPRDWRDPDLRILTFAILIAVAAVSAVSFFTDRIQQLINLQAAELLAADLKITSPDPLPDRFLQKAEDMSLNTAQFMTFPTVALHQGRTTLAQVKAVNAGYPLRGQLTVAQRAFGPETTTTAVPPLGKIWVETRLLNELKLTVGNHLNIGYLSLEIERVLTLEPDRSGQLFQLTPRILMNLADVDKTGLITLGSRVNYHLLLAGEATNIKQYRQWASTQLAPGQSLKGIEGAQPALRAALKRAQQFLGLAAMIAVVLAGAAVAVAARHFSQKQADASAIMRCLGAKSTFILQIYLWRLLLIGLLASGLGCLLGWVAQWGLAQLLTFSNIALPLPSGMPVLLGFAVGLVTLMGFALPPVLRIQQVPPLRVLRQELGTVPPRVWQIILLAGLTMAILIFWQAGEPILGTWMLGGITGTLLLLGLTGYGVIWALKQLKWQGGLGWRFGLMQLTRRAQTSSLQLAALGLGMMVLLLLAIVRVDLINAWQQQVSPGTPNYFLLNIQPVDVPAMKDFLEQRALKHSGFFPLAVGRFVAINDTPLKPENYTDPRARRLATRTFHLSSATDLPADNQVVAGEFNHAQAEKELSVEKGFANSLKINLGDKLHFQIGGQTVSGEVTSLRTLQWDSFNVNFFVLASPDLTANIPKMFITSFHLPVDETYRDLIPQLVQTFPSVTVVDIHALLRQVRTIIERATLAVEYVFGFTLLAGLMVLYAAMTASHEERLHEGAILRVLGAKRRQILASLWTEFLILGGLAGLLAAMTANALGYGLAVFVFELPYQFNLQIWLWGIIGGALGISLAGILGTQMILNHPPLKVLRRA